MTGSGKGSVEGGQGRGADPARLAEGWVRRFIADAARADEAVALYRSLGMEAEADPARPDALNAGCGDCQLVQLLNFRVIYTRRRDPDR